jgi:hypothetical protein
VHHGKGSKYDLKHVHVLGMATYASKHALDTPQNLYFHLYPITQLIFEEIKIIVCEHSFASSDFNSHFHKHTIGGQ